MSRFELLDLTDGRQILVYGHTGTILLPETPATLPPARSRRTTAAAPKRRTTTKHLGKTVWRKAQRLWGKGFSASRIIGMLDLDVTPAAVYFQASRKGWTRNG